MTEAAQPSSSNDDRPLLQVEGLRKHFPAATSRFRRNERFIHAVDDVNFTLGRGESLGLVGESGCGKTTTGKMLVRLIDPTDGHVIFDDGTGEPTDIATLRGKPLKEFRKHAQMIFQDPYESMNPRRTIFDTVAEPLQVQDIGTLVDRIDRVTEMLALVGLTPPRAFLFRYPHELSGVSASASLLPGR